MSKTKIDIFSGFLGAGKTTLIKKLIAEGYKNEKLVLIENEFGEIGIDGGFMQDAGIEVTEMNSGCICCSLVGDFAEALKKVIDEYSPDRIIIEPSGVGKLSDVIKAVKGIDSENVELNSFVAVCDASKTKMYVRNFGEFYLDQVESASCIVMSHVQKTSDEKLNEAVGIIREHNGSCSLITTDWDSLTGEQILKVIEGENTLHTALEELEHEHHHHEHGHHHHHDEECDCGCHEHGHHHHHHHGEECDCGCHEHHHEHEHHHHHHDEECDCGCHEHGHHHHHHHADEVFTSWGKETAKKFCPHCLEEKLNSLADEDRFGFVLRAKGIVEGENGKWIYFDYVPGEADVREGAPSAIGRICVIGSKINEAEIEKLFGA